MDTWQEDQVKRMQLGGNAAFKQFMQSYPPAEQGGYSDGMSKYDQYHCWAAAQYRSKLDADVAGTEFSPSPPPDNFKSPSMGGGSPAMSSSQGLRKSRASARNNSSMQGGSGSPASSFGGSGSPRMASPDPDQKTANESFFASLGQANSMRSAELPPSQGGRYQGFGNTPSPPPVGNAQHPSFSMSSANAPSLAEFTENPMAALGKGWSLFSTAVSGATKVVSENVINPGLERVKDPNLHASVTGYLTDAQKRAAELGNSANQWGRSQFGVDVGGSVANAFEGVRDRVGGSNGPSREGYGALHSDGWGDYHGDTSSGGRYDDNHEEDFFDKFGGQPRGDVPANPGGAATTSAKQTSSSSAPAKKNEGWDDWDDF
jgi:ADP-ribosylation factor GTPase-activating protein 1